MGLTYDYRDVPRKHRGAATAGGSATPSEHQDSLPGREEQDRPELLAIPRILRRRARWVGARLRHSARNG